MQYPVVHQTHTTIYAWSEALAERAGISQQEFQAAPERHMGYPLSSVRVELMDGSKLEFKYAFALVSEKLRAVAVFSEHCGSFVLPYHEAKVYQDGQLQFSQGAA